MLIHQHKGNRLNLTHRGGVPLLGSQPLKTDLTSKNLFQATAQRI